MQFRDDSLEYFQFRTTVLIIFLFGTAELDFKQFWNDRSKFAPNGNGNG